MINSRPATPNLGFRILFLLVFPVLAQAQTQPFQQRVDYDLQAQLLPDNHSIKVAGQFLYHNNSPEPLDSIPVMLWANAYSQRDNAFAKQKRRMNDVEFLFAPDEDLGGYRDLKFGGPEMASSSQTNPELVWIRLVNPLSPKDSVAISFDYQLRIPKTFSRMGRDNGAYYLTQWYPKVALYNENGWHIYPYLDLGEYFNDFGNYHVRITVPTNGMVAATGELINQEGKSLLENRISATENKPEQIDSLKYGSASSTFEYNAHNVTDFAWFVNARYRVDRTTARLQYREIPAYAFYQSAEASLWDTAATLIARAAVYADSLVGAYPHPQITAVSAPLGVGGGMEYPMITVIGPTRGERSLDQVLAHEAFHNWFALTVASNERIHPWMDEGMTSWLENRYMKRYYADYEGQLENAPKFLAGESPYDLASIFHKVLATAQRHPKPDTHSDSLSTVTYGYAAYTQPNLLFDFAEYVLGQQKFDEAVAKYYRTWQMGHPGPMDLQASLGGDTLKWLFEDLILDNKLPDYKIKSAIRDGALVNLIIENNGDTPSPLILAYQFEDETYTESVILPGFLGEQSLQISVPKSAVRIAIDPELRSPEINRKDNYRSLEGFTPSIEPLKVNLLTHLGHPDRNDVNLIPFITYNAADQVLLGFGVHNYTVDVGATRYYIMPQVATRDASFNGLAGFKHSLYEDSSWWRELEFSAVGRRYGYNRDKDYEFTDRYERGTLATELLLKSPIGLQNDHRFRLEAHFVKQLYARGLNREQRTFLKERQHYSIYELSYNFQHRDPINPAEAQVNIEAGKGYSRLSTTLNYALRYQKNPNFIRLRAFAGTFLNRDNPKVRAVLLPNGTTGFFNSQYDYTFEQNIIKRSEPSNQYFVRDGSLTLPFLLPVSASTEWLTSLSLTVDAPFNLPILSLSAYADIAVYPDTRPGMNGIVAPATSGLRLSLPNKLVSVSFPLANTSLVRDAIEFDKGYGRRIAFSLDFSVANVDELLRQFRG